MGEASRPIRIGVDIGGTFTDLILVDDGARRVFAAKVLTTPHDPGAAVLDGTARVLGEAGAGLQAVRNIVHGTTLATNAIIERKGARTALLTTKGFRDVLETGKELRYDLYDLFIEFPTPLVPRRLRYGVSERTRYGGQILEPLDEQEVKSVLERLAAAGVESVAVCFLHAYANPGNEHKAERQIKARRPDLNLAPYRLLDLPRAHGRGGRDAGAAGLRPARVRGLPPVWHPRPRHSPGGGFPGISAHQAEGSSERI